jgi:hypothetical protein
MRESSSGCDSTIKNLLTLYAGGELTDEEREIVERHIKVCDECKIEAEGYKKTTRKLSDLKKIEAPVGVWEDMWLGIKEGLVRERRGKVFEFATYLQVILLMLILGLGVGFFGYIIAGVLRDRQQPTVFTTPVSYSVDGALVQDVDEVLKKYLNIQGGVVIQDIQSDGFLAKAGFQKDDVIIKLNGIEIKNSSDLLGKISALKSQETATIILLRKGQELTIGLKR